MSFLLLCCFILISSCASEPKTASKSDSPFSGGGHEQPCTLYSDGSYFAGMGIGTAMKKDEAKDLALANAQKFCAMLMAHSYQGMISDFMQEIGHNNATDIESKISMAGDRIIKAELEDSTPTCLEYAYVQTGQMSGQQGREVEAYISIRIDKKKLAAKIAKEVSQSLPADEKEKIQMDEEKFRERMEKAFEKETGK